MFGFSLNVNLVASKSPKAKKPEKTEKNPHKNLLVCFIFILIICLAVVLSNRWKTCATISFLIILIIFIVCFVVSMLFLLVSLLLNIINGIASFLPGDEKHQPIAQQMPAIMTSDL